jgi:hypothetical protein
MKKGAMGGRLTEEFRNRTKVFAAAVIRLFVKLTKQREEVRVVGKQLLRSGIVRVDCDSHHNEQTNEGGKLTTKSKNSN